MRESSSQLGIKIERISKKNYQLSAWGWDENVSLGEMNGFLTHAWLCIHLYPRVNVVVPSVGDPVPPPQGTSLSVWRHFWLLQLVGSAVASI